MDKANIEKVPILFCSIFCLQYKSLDPNTDEFSYTEIIFMPFTLNRLFSAQRKLQLEGSMSNQASFGESLSTFGYNLLTSRMRQ